MKVMGEVWELELPHNLQSVLLALADHADHRGENARPSVELLAWKTGYGGRQVKRILRMLEAQKLIEPMRRGGGRALSTCYRLLLQNGVRKSPFRTDADEQPVVAANGETVSSAQETVTSEGVNSDIAVTPEPLNHPEPSSSDSSLRSESGVSRRPKLSTSRGLGSVSSELRRMAGRRDEADPVHESRTRLFTLLQEKAWLASMPPPWSERSTEADVLGQLLKHNSEDVVALAIEGARRIVDETVPFSVKLLVDTKMFRWAHDVAVRRGMVSEEVRNVFCQVLGRLAAA